MDVGERIGGRRMILKFRAYSNYSKEIYDVLLIDFKEEEVLLSDKWDGTWSDFKHIELMQSTGILDKNKIEIFEGDIVNIMQYFGGHPYGEIEHVIKRSEYNNCLIASRLKEDMFVPEKRLYFNASEDYEVVGNIYET